MFTNGIINSSGVLHVGSCPQTHTQSHACVHAHTHTWIAVQLDSSPGSYPGKARRESSGACWDSR